MTERMTSRTHSHRSEGYSLLIGAVLLLPFCQGADLIGYEGQASILECPNPPGTSGSSLSISWYKQSVTSLEDDDLLLANRVAIYNRVLDQITGPIYEGDLVDRAELNLDTGTLTIFSTQILDEHMYVCFNTPGGKGAVNLGVYVKPSELFLDAPSSQIVENTTVTFTCTAERVRPQPTSMYFTFTDDEGTQLGIRNTVEIPGESGVFRDVVTLEYTAVYTDASRTLRCVLDLGIAGQVTEDYELSIMYRPRGSPTLTLSSDVVSVGWTVEITCDAANIDSGAAGVTWYTFYRDDVLFDNSTSNSMEIEIEGADNTGNFTCIVGNPYGSSQLSQVVPLGFSEVPIPQSSAPVELIVGVVAGVVLIVVIILIIFVIRRKSAKKDPGEKSENLFKRSHGADVIRGSNHSLDAMAGPATGPLYEEVSNGPSGGARAAKPTPAPRGSQKKPKTPQEPVYAEPQKPTRNNNDPSQLYAQPHKNRKPPGRVNNNETPPTGRHIDSEGKLYVDIDFTNEAGGPKTPGPRKPPRTFANTPAQEPVEYAQVSFTKPQPTPSQFSEPGQYANLQPPGTIYANAP